VSPYLQNGLISMVWANAPTSLLMIGDWCAGLLRCFVWQHYSDCQWGMYWSTSMYVGIWLLWDFEFELFGPKELSKYDRRWVQRFHMSDNQIITIDWLTQLWMCQAILVITHAQVEVHVLD
jgi:hypothetical protein